MKRQTTRSPAAIGLVTLVLIFVLLCLMTLSVLSLVTARADLRQSTKSAEQTTAYYEAENRANDILLAIIEILDRHENAPDSTSFLSSVRLELESSDTWEDLPYAGDGSILTFPDDTHINYTVPAGNERLLNVTLELSHEEQKDGKHYRILEWNILSTHEWEPENLPLYEP